MSQTVSSPGSRARGGSAAAALAALLLVLPGCEALQPRNKSSTSKPPGPLLLNQGAALKPVETFDAAAVATRDDIVAINQFWNAVPWLYDADDEVVGFRVPVYFVSAETEKGVFVAGRVFCWLYEVKAKAGGRGSSRTALHVWELDPSAALPFRVRKKSINGYFYGFMLNWPKKLDVAGKQIEIVFGYERADGRVITGSGKRFKVPLPAGTPPGPRGAAQAES